MVESLKKLKRQAGTQPPTPQHPPQHAAVRVTRQNNHYRGREECMAVLPALKRTYLIATIDLHAVKMDIVQRGAKRGLSCRETSLGHSRGMTCDRFQHPVQLKYQQN